MNDHDLIDRLCVGRLAIDEAIAVLRARLPLQNGSGGTNLIYPTQAEAESRAGDFRAEGRWCEVVPRGGEWEVVMLGERTVGNAGE